MTILSRHLKSRGLVATTARCIVGAIMAAIAITAFLALPAMADDTGNPRLAEDVALTKETVSLLRSKNFQAVRDRLDPSLKVSDDMLRQLSDVMGQSEPVSIEDISVSETREMQTGNGTARVLLEYNLGGNGLS